MPFIACVTTPSEPNDKRKRNGEAMRAWSVCIHPATSVVFADGGQTRAIRAETRLSAWPTPRHANGMCAASTRDTLPGVAGTWSERRQGTYARNPKFPYAAPCQIRRLACWMTFDHTAWMVLE